MVPVNKMPPESKTLPISEESEPGFAQFSDVLQLTLEEMGERSGSALTGLLTGFVDFDRLSQGLHPGALVIIASFPGMGKTSLALNIAQHVSMRERKAVGVLSLEMSQQELALRILCSEAEIPFSRMRANRVSQKEWVRIIQTVRIIGDAPLFIDDSHNLTLSEVEEKARSLKREKEVALLILDYLQLMETDRKYDNRNLAIAAIVRGLKDLARELGIPIIALHSLPRPTRSIAQPPHLSDLDETLNLDDDADMVVFIHRNPSQEDRGFAELIIAKQRTGETDTLELVFRDEIATFRNPEKEPAADMGGQGSLEGDKQIEPAPDFRQWIGQAKQAPENPNPRFRSDDDLWN